MLKIQWWWALKLTTRLERNHNTPYTLIFILWTSKFSLTTISEYWMLGSTKNGVGEEKENRKRQAEYNLEVVMDKCKQDRNWMIQLYPFLHYIRHPWIIPKEIHNSRYHPTAQLASEVVQSRLRRCTKKVTLRNYSGEIIGLVEAGKVSGVERECCWHMGRS